MKKLNVQHARFKLAVINSFRRLKIDMDLREEREKGMEETIKLIQKDLEMLKESNRPIDRATEPKNTIDRAVEKIDQEIKLLPSEKKILAILNQYQGTALTYIDIADLSNLNPTTIKNTINRIKDKSNFIIKVESKDKKNRYTLNDKVKARLILT